MSVSTSTTHSHSIRSGRLLREKGFRLESPPLALVSFDPAGDGDDYPALNVTYREEWQLGDPIDPDFAVEKLYRVQMARRLPQQIEFVDAMAALLRLARHLAQLRDSGKIVDYRFTVETNGVGHGYASALTSKLGVERVIRIFTTGGVDSRQVAENKVTMPRMAALDLVRMLVEMQYVRVADEAVGAEDLFQEMQTFVWRGKNRPEAMEGQHDDLVLAFAMSVWTGEKLIPPLLRQIRARRPNGRIAA